MNRPHMPTPQKIKLYPPRKPGTVLVTMVEVEKGTAAMARIIERIPSTKAIRVVSPSGITRSVSYMDAELVDMPADEWDRAVKIAAAKAIIAQGGGTPAQRVEVMCAEHMLGFQVV